MHIALMSSARSGVLGFLLALASLLGGGVFFLPEIVEPLPLGWAIGLVSASTLIFAATTVAFTNSLDRYLGELDSYDSTDFISSLLEARLGNRPAKAIGFLLVTQSVLFLYGYMHEVSRRTAQVLDLRALPIAAAVALIIVAQQRGKSTKASINSAQTLAAVNAIVLLSLLAFLAMKVDFGSMVPIASHSSLQIGTLFVTVSFSFSLLYGHVGAATAVVAARERSIPTRFVHIGVAAGVLFVGLVLVITIVLHRAVPSGDEASPAFFLDRLATFDSASLSAFATVYLVGQLLLQALQTSLGITMLSRDWLNSRRPSTPTFIASLPAAAVVLLAGVGAELEVGGYQTALALSGVLLVPVLGGFIPLLICHCEQTARRTMLSTRFAIGVATVGLLVPTVGHGAFVWPGAGHRSLIALTLSVVIAIMAESVMNPATSSGGRIGPRRVVT